MTTLPVQGVWVNTHGPLSLQGVPFVYTWSSMHPDGLYALQVAEQYHRVYKNAGLRVVGVHIGRKSVQDVERVRSILARDGVTHPVIVGGDTEGDLAEGPSVLRVGDQESPDVHPLSGADIETQIRTAMVRSGRRVPVRPLSVTSRQPMHVLTFGAGQGCLQNQGVERGYMRLYRAPRIAAPDRPWVDGRWSLSDVDLTSGGGRLHVPLEAGHAQLLAEAAQKAQIVVQWNGVPVAIKEAGDAMTFLKNISVIMVRHAGPYQTWFSDKEQRGVLTFAVPPGVKVFGVALGAPVV